MVVLVVLQLAALVCFQIAKRRITQPRIGFVRFSPERQRKKRKTSAIFAVSALVTAALVVFTATRSGGEGLGLVERNTMVIGFGVWLLIVFALAAYWMDRPRLFAVACTIVLSLWTVMFLDSALGFLLSGVAFLIAGVHGLSRFVQSYPVEREATTDGP
jgi:hypothetical protein